MISLTVKRQTVFVRIFLILFLLCLPPAWDTAPVVLLGKALEIREINPAATALAGRGVIDGEGSGDALIRLDRGGTQVYLQTNASLVLHRPGWIT